MIIKVCGLRNGEDIQQIAALGVDWIGMVFWDKSPRNVTMIPTYAGIIPDRAPEGPDYQENRFYPTRVGIFVDEMAQNIITRAVNFKLNIIQLQGKETPTFIRNLRATLDPDLCPGIKFMKVITIPLDDSTAYREDIATYKQYEDCVDYFLFDTKQMVATDGPHDMNAVFEAYNGKKPFLLSSGIEPEDAELIRSLRHHCFAGIDLNSSFEEEAGVKDIQKLKSFLQLL